MLILFAFVLALSVWCVNRITLPCCLIQVATIPGLSGHVDRICCLAISCHIVTYLPISCHLMSWGVTYMWPSSTSFDLSYGVTAVVGGFVFLGVKDH